LIIPPHASNVYRIIYSNILWKEETWSTINVLKMVTWDSLTLHFSSEHHFLPKHQLLLEHIRETPANPLQLLPHVLDRQRISQAKPDWGRKMVPVREQSRTGAYRPLMSGNLLADDLLMCCCSGPIS
jgi:hypothetical protein